MLKKTLVLLAVSVALVAVTAYSWGGAHHDRSTWAPSPDPIYELCPPDLPSGMLC